MYQADHRVSASADFAMIWSSMSVTLRMCVTSRPLRSSQRTSTSKARKERRWPRCGAPWVVGPQTYSDTAPSRTGVNGAVLRVAVSCSWRFTPSRVLPRQARSERDRGRHPPSGLRSRTGRSAAAGAGLLAVELLEGVVVGDGVLAALALYRVQGGLGGLDGGLGGLDPLGDQEGDQARDQIGRASCREGVEM